MIHKSLHESWGWLQGQGIGFCFKIHKYACGIATSIPSSKVVQGSSWASVMACTFQAFDSISNLLYQGDEKESWIERNRDELVVICTAMQ
eukprot:566156-Pelagomonas_calceolata.AAC.1